MKNQDSDHLCVLVSQLCLILCETMDCSPPGSSVHGILQQEYWSGLPFPFPGGLPDPGIKPKSPALQADSLPPELQGSHLYFKIRTRLYDSSFKNGQITHQWCIYTKRKTFSTFSWESNMLYLSLAFWTSCFLGYYCFLLWRYYSKVSSHLLEYFIFSCLLNLYL